MSEGAAKLEDSISATKRQMPWRQTLTSELIKGKSLQIGDGYRAKNSELGSSGLPFARAGNINNGFRFESADYLPHTYAARVGDKLSRPGDTVFTSKGTVGRFAYVRETTEPFVYSPQLCFWRSLKVEDIVPRFLFFWMQSKEFLEQVEGTKGQTDMADYVNLADQRRMTITLPPAAEQRAIAELLGTLDDKIDLLRRQNQALEAMAETLFRQWFGDDAGAHWTEGTVEELFELQRGYDLPTQHRVDGSFAIVASSGYSGHHHEHKVKGPGVVTGRSGLIGQVFLVKEDFWPLNTTLYVKTFKRATPAFAYLFLKTMDLGAFNAGSAVPTLNRNHVHANATRLPPRDLIERFESIVAPLFDKIHFNTGQTRSLEALRDNLLPKLMSGKIRVAC